MKSKEKRFVQMIHGVDHDFELPLANGGAVVHHANDMVITKCVRLTLVVRRIQNHGGSDTKISFIFFRELSLTVTIASAGNSCSAQMRLVLLHEEAPHERLLPLPRCILVRVQTILA